MAESGAGGGGRAGRLLGVALLVALGAGAILTVSALRGASGEVITDRALAWYLDWQSADLAAPGTEGEPVTFEVAAGEGLTAVATRLESRGLIRDADAFRLLARVQGLDTGVQAGSHSLRPNMSAAEVLDALQVGRAAGLRVTIREGLRAEEVADILEGAGVAERADFLRLVGAGQGGWPAVADRPVGAGLEGYLFPDTYEFEADAGAEVVLGRMLDTFEARVSEDLRAKARAAGLSLYEVVTLASIVERETPVAAERSMVARVYLNRLAEPPYLLNADPTVQYGLGYQVESGTWWKRPLTYEDLRSPSGYNSYLHPGLPPGPIASPGLAAIEAVLNPAEGPWMYFVANDRTCDGTHVFATTYDEHLANVASYQTGDCGP